MQLKNLKITAMGGDCEKTATIRNGRRNFGSKGWSLRFARDSRLATC